MGRCFLLAISLLLLSLLLHGCWADPPLSNREEGVLVGAAVGAGSGAAIGSISGHAGAGAAIGAATGAVAGGIAGNAEDVREDDAAKEELLRKQEKIIHKQGEEIEDVERQQLYDSRYEQYLERNQ